MNIISANLIYEKQNLGGQDENFKFSTSIH